MLACRAARGEGRRADARRASRLPASMVALPGVPRREPYGNACAIVVGVSGSLLVAQVVEDRRPARRRAVLERDEELGAARLVAAARAEPAADQRAAAATSSSRVHGSHRQPVGGVVRVDPGDVGAMSASDAAPVARRAAGARSCFSDACSACALG